MTARKSYGLQCAIIHVELRRSWRKHQHHSQQSRVVTAVCSVPQCYRSDEIVAIKQKALIEFEVRTSTLDLSTPKHVTSIGYPIASLNTLGSFVLSYAAGSETNKQTN